MRLLLLIACFFVLPVAWGQHPVAFSKKGDFDLVKKSLAGSPLLKTSFADIKNSVDPWIGKDVDVPFPKDAAGGYTHDRHKANYMLMFNSGVLYNLTGDARYASLVRQLFLKYAVLNPQLKNHPKATSNSPGRLFWQALNDANWLVYTGMAYDLIYNTLTPADRKLIEEGAFAPEVNYFMTDLESWFNLIHNHGVWACAGVGIVGIATNNTDYVDKALYGTKKDGKSGFIAQMDNLFSPDGYYTEGPYYVRYALLPYYIFANALNNARPQLRIFEHRGQILRKALVAGLQQTNIDGRFYPFNDAIKEKNYSSNELVTAVSIAREVFGPDPGLLTVAKKQGRVLLTRGGALVAAEINGSRQLSPYYPYRTVEYTDGAKGDEGGISFLRAGTGADQTTLIYKYTAHGLSHGHFDKLNFSLWNKGSEVIQDYGAVRFVNVEQKYGGRYLPESDAYAAQTIAHNTLVADEQSHFGGKEKIAEKYHSEKVFSSTQNPNVQVVGAKDEHAYSDIKMHRVLYLLQLPGSKVVVDIFQALSPNQHQYDLPFQYSGQVIHTSFKYTAYTEGQKALGKRNGYQFLWKEAEASVKDTVAQFTFLNNGTYYTVSSLIRDSAQLLFARTGANDPNFNLRREPSYIIRKRGADQTFVNVVEIHGQYDPIAEFSTNSYPLVKNIGLLYQDADYTVAGITIGNDELLVAQSNRDSGAQAKHRVQKSGLNLQWTGPFTVRYNKKPL